MSKSIIGRLLAPLERREQQATYKPLHRKILLIISSLFCALAIGVFWVAPKDQLAGLLPVLIFGGVGSYGLLAGVFGSDKAVANIWFTQRKR